MDSSKARTGEGIAGISGMALILIMLLFAWFGVSQGGGLGRLDAFDALDDWVDLILLLAADGGHLPGAGRDLGQTGSTCRSR